MNNIFKAFLVLGVITVVSCGEKTDSKETVKSIVKPVKEEMSSDNSGSYTIVLFDNDSLIKNYQYSKDLETKITRKERSLLASRDEKMKDFQEMYNTLAQKAPTMTQLEGQEAERKLMLKQQELDDEDQKVNQQYIKWKTDLLIEYQKHLDSVLNIFRIENDIDILIPSGGGITKFYYAEPLDMTTNLVDYLNLAYAKKVEIAEK